MLDLQDAKYQKELQEQLRVLQGQMAEAAAVAQELHDAGLGADHSDLLAELDELRRLCVSMGADEQVTPRRD